MAVNDGDEVLAFYALLPGDEPLACSFILQLFVFDLDRIIGTEGQRQLLSRQQGGIILSTDEDAVSLQPPGTGQ